MVDILLLAAAIVGQSNNNMEDEDGLREGVWQKGKRGSQDD